MGDEGNLKTGTAVPRAGTYRCCYCGPDGLGATALKHAAESMGFPYQPPPVASKEPPVAFFEEGQALPPCPNCADVPTGDCTGWGFVSEGNVDEDPVLLLNDTERLMFRHLQADVMEYLRKGKMDNALMMCTMLGIKEGRASACLSAIAASDKLMSRYSENAPAKQAGCLLLFAPTLGLLVDRLLA